MLGRLYGITCASALRFTQVGTWPGTLWLQSTAACPGQHAVPLAGIDWD